MSDRLVAGPVGILTNRRTASAAEELVLALKARGRATTIGDTTTGATASVLVRELPNGWTYDVPEWIEYTLEGRTFEGVGLAPDIVVIATRTDVQRRADLVLERATTVCSAGQ